MYVFCVLFQLLSTCHGSLVLTLSCRYRPRDPLMNSETLHYKRGASQVFTQSLHVIDPTKFPEEDVCYLFIMSIYLLLVHAVTAYGSVFSVVCDFFVCLFVNQISRERLNGFAPNSQGRRVWSLARRSLNVKVKGQVHQRTKTCCELPSPPAAMERSCLLHDIILQ